MVGCVSVGSVPSNVESILYRTFGPPLPCGCNLVKICYVLTKPSLKNRVGPSNFFVDYVLPFRPYTVPLTADCNRTLSLSRRTFLFRILPFVFRRTGAGPLTAALELFLQFLCGIVRRILHLCVSISDDTFILDTTLFGRIQLPGAKKRWLCN